ncbi:MAG: PEGA domain-containing protein [Candidatus Omnitrophica bacterium]|nr:PEGA domain-containing protein [Candidatus Omnitrophota bacterium]
MILLRRIVLYLFTLIYLVFCPLTIFYALGFMYQPGSEHGIVKTGLVYVSTVPSGATVYLNDMRYEGTTPSVIRNLIPGSYQVRVELKGHQLWNQEVPVEAEHASVLEKMLLLPESLKKHSLGAQSFEQMTVIPGTPFLLLARGKKISECFVYDLKKKLEYPLSGPLFEWEDAKVLQTHLVSRAKTIVVKLERQNARRFYQFDLSLENTPKDLTSLFPEEPKKILWDPSAETHLLVFKDKHLNYLRSDKKTIYPKVAGNVQGFGVENKNLYLLRDDHTFAVMTLDGRNEKALLKDAVLGESLFEDKGFYDIDVLSPELILFLGEKGALISNRLPYRFAHAEVKGYDYAPRQKKLLVWTRSEIGVIDFSKAEESETDVFEKGPRLIWMFTRGKSIQKATWIYDAAHVIFQDQDHLVFLDLETFNKAETHELLQMKEDTAYHYTDQTGLLYFLDRESGKLTAAELLPKRELILLPFPTRQEKTVKRRLMML